MTTDPAPVRARDGRTRLLEAAERLLDERGIDGTTAAAIIQEAGHRNATAVNYYFGKLDHLIAEVVERRAADINERRNQLFDELEAAGAVDPRDALRGLVQPAAELLDRPEGRRYLRLLNQAANHPRFHDRAGFGFTTSMQRGAAHLAPLLVDLPDGVRQTRGRYVLGMALFALADQAWLIDNPQPDREPLGTEAFVADLVEAGLAALRA